jgi:Tol biopolymer transport system component
MISIRALILGGLSLVAAASASLATDRIVFLRSAPAESTLYIANADGSEEKPLTQPGSMNYNPAWSARGDWIAFTSDRAGSADLFRMHPDGTGQERLTDDPGFDDQAAFSPDAKRIAFVSTRAAGRANLWILDIASRKITRLTSGDGGDFRPAWSPDGQWIAFSSDRGSELPSAKGRWERLQLVDLYVIHPDGTGIRRVSQHGNFCGSPKWLADGKHLVADCMSAEETWDYRVRFYPDQQSQIFQIEITSGAATAMTTGPDVKLAPSVLSSGELAYVLASKSGKTVVYAGGKVGPAGADLARNPPVWSPDAKRIVYSRQKSNRTAEPVQLWSRNPKFSLYTTTFLPAYDLKSEHLAVTKIDTNGTSLYVIEDGKPAQAVMQRKDLILGPQWSPDGKQIVVGVGGFTSFLDFAAGGLKPIDPVNGGAEVGILNADGSGFHVLTSGANNNAFASFSPDGKQIVYRTAGPEGQGLRIMNLEDRSIKVLTDKYDNFPVWSSRNLIGFIRRMGNDFEIMTVTPDGKNLKQLTDVRGNEAHLAWSPDGERLAFTSSRMGFKDEALYTNAPQPYGEIFVMHYDGTEVEQLTDDQWEEGGPAWQAGSAGSTTTGSSLPSAKITTLAVLSR